MLEPGSRVLVTGANGFIGSHVAEALRARGYEVRCMVRRTSDLSHVRHLSVEWSYADVRDAAALRESCAGLDAVCHCAALTRALDEETFMRVNAGGAEALARAALEANPGLQRFLFVSSLAAAGPSNGPGDHLDENRPARPVTWYGKSKLAAEQALLALSLQAGGRLPLTIVRPPPVFGPRDRDFLAYFRLIGRGLNLQIGHTERWATMVYVRDLVSLLLSALVAPQAEGQTYFASAFDCSYAQLAAAIASVMGKRTLALSVPVRLLALLEPIAGLQGRITRRPVLLNSQRLIDLRQRYWLCSAEKARRELYFAPEYDLLRGVRETAHWYREEGWLS